MRGVTEGKHETPKHGRTRTFLLKSDADHGRQPILPLVLPLRAAMPRKKGTTTRRRKAQEVFDDDDGDVDSGVCLTSQTSVCCTRHRATRHNAVICRTASALLQKCSSSDRSVEATGRLTCTQDRAT